MEEAGFEIEYGRAAPCLHDLMQRIREIAANGTAHIRLVLLPAIWVALFAYAVGSTDGSFLPLLSSKLGQPRSREAA